MKFLDRSPRISPASATLFLLLAAPLATHFAARLNAQPPGAPPMGGRGKMAPIKIRPINAKAAAKVSYHKQIKPLFEAKCITCHDSESHKGGLDMSSVAAMRKGGEDAGPSIISGKPDSSPLVQYIRGLKKPQMPMRKKPLTEAELHLVRQWIAAGAKDKD